MQELQKICVAFGSVVLLLGATLSVQPQVVRRKNLPVTAEPERKATTRIPSDQVVAAPEEPSAESKTFQQPRYLDDRLDWCMKWGSDCGKPVAEAFCRPRH